MHVSGTAGYIAEWELNGEAVLQTSGNVKELNATLVWKHVGLCSVNEPEEKSGQIEMRISKSGTSARVHATLSMGDASCTYDGKWSDGTSGFMDCTDGKGIPLTLLLK